MNRKKFIEDFDYSILQNYIENIEPYSTKITHTMVQELLELIYSKYPEINKNNISFSNYTITFNIGTCYVEDSDINIYHQNIQCLQFEAFFPNIFYQKFINNEIDYNENIFLLYSLLHYFRNICKKEHPNDLYPIFRILYHSFYSYLSIRKYIKKHYPYEYFSHILHIFHDNILYVDTDVLYLRDISYNDIQSILHENDINIEYSIYRVNCVYVLSKKNILTYYKENDKFKFNRKGFLRKDKEVEIIEKKIIRDLRISKIANLLNNNE